MHCVNVALGIPNLGAAIVARHATNFFDGIGRWQIALDPLHV
jgi:hypothetical protein